jgi:hypothetical protein
MSGTRFLQTLIASLVVLVMSVYMLILLVDPYQNVPFSLAFERAPISTNQRFAYPALARDPGFDSVVIGSSTLRLLNPDNLNALTHARFANLAMNSATAYEQMRMHELFVRHHPRAKHVIIGIDDSWCRRATSYEKYTFREFPEWMYDDNRWNDLLYMFNDKALENTVRLLEFVSGHRTAKYETDGYRNFTTDFGAYDLDSVRARLYPQGRPQTRRIPNVVPEHRHPGWTFAAHALLEVMLARGVGATATILIFAPLHGDYLARSESLYRECKARVVMQGQKYGAHMIDFMIDSEITRVDENYWDSLHFRDAVARLIEQSIAGHFAGNATMRQRFVTY